MLLQLYSVMRISLNYTNLLAHKVQYGAFTLYVIGSNGKVHLSIFSCP